MRPREVFDANMTILEFDSVVEVVGGGEEEVLWSCRSLSSTRGM